jgi:Arc/MetJ family transcription regulator
MRTNIELDDDLIREARKYSTARTKRALIEEALRALIETKSLDQRRKEHDRRSAEIREITKKLKIGSTSAMILRDRKRGD